ncbi:Uncharacterised protein [Mycobacterium tuberculosis]|nr:Uncharacterised protein [Mycobacterium tuberculosis]COY84544.1 Uncharacterised protein [Mycobacterium tuberculosis]COZ18330.1 Uncharacterised protein [Mycobacterium tuberculosis]
MASSNHMRFTAPLTEIILTLVFRPSRGPSDP